MGWEPRIEGGLPRGGLGYPSLPLCAAALVLQCRFEQEPAGRRRTIVLREADWPTAAAALLVPPGVWLALGLRADGGAGENADEVVDEERNLWWWAGFGPERWVSIWRLSALAVLLGVAALACSAWRVWSRAGGWH